MAAVRADIGRHILDQTQDRGLQLLEHVDRLLGIQHRHILRGRHHHRARQLGALAQRQLNVPRPRRQVDDQHIQLAPQHLPQKLLQRPHDHRAAPHHGLIVFQHQPQRHHGDAMGLNRLDQFPVRRRRALRHPHHARLAGAIDVGIQQPHPAALAGQRHGQVRGYGGFAHPTLARPHDDDIGNPGNWLRPALMRRRMLADLQAGRLPLGARCRCLGRRPPRRAMRRHHDLHRTCPRRAQRRLGGRLHRTERARLIRRGRFQHESHCLALDAQRPNKVPAEKIAPAGARDPRQNPVHRRQIKCHLRPRVFRPSPVISAQLCALRQRARVR